MESFDERLARLDLTLFENIQSQTTPSDRRSLLAVQQVLHSRDREFVYLEIGSHLGGSLQSVLVDPLCSHVISIDARPSVQPDERGADQVYAENATARMIKNLAHVPGVDLSKLRTIDSSTGSLGPKDVPFAPDLCFIDGEHTDTAALRDARFCMSVMKSNGTLLFHDAAIVYRGLKRLVDELREAGLRFRAYNLPTFMFVIEFGPNGLAEAEPVHGLLLDNHEGYLAGLMSNDHYRAFLTRPVFQVLRRIKRQLRGFSEA